MANFTKSDLVDALAKRAAIPKRAAGIVLDTMLSIIRDEADAGKTVTLTGFGRFAIKDRAARTARNPRTGATVEVPAKRVLTFAPSKSST